MSGGKPGKCTSKFLPQNTQKNKIKIKKKKELQFLQNQILKAKIKISPNQKQTNTWQQELEDIENYKTQGTVIRNKEKIINNQEKPNKFFYQQEKQKQKNSKKIKIFIIQIFKF